MPEPIILYDITGSSKDKAWSPNTWKTRFCLNFKGLPYRTVWVEYPDIADVCKELGIEATTMIPGPTPRPLYTLPAIVDPNTNKALAESTVIARYLDATYPDTPRLIPAEADAFHAAFNDIFQAQILMQLITLCVLPTYKQLLPRSQEYFRRTRETWFGAKLEEIAPEGSLRCTESFAAIEKAFASMSEWLEADGKSKAFFMGDKICYADITIASFLLWAKIVWGEDSQEWKTVAGWNGGRWMKLLDAFKTYVVVDVGTDN